MSSSQFTANEIRSIIIAWVVLSVAISIGIVYSYGISVFEAVSAALIATATAFILHEMGHKFVAIRHGYVAHFQIWTWGILLTLITAIAFRGAFLFGAPGAVYIAPAAAYGFGYYASNYKRSDPQHENMIISAAGPGINLAFALVFLALILLTPSSGIGSSFLSTVEQIGFSLNVGLGSFNMLPIPPIDGYKIFKGSIPIGLAIAIPLWAMFLIFFLGIGI